MKKTLLEVRTELAETITKKLTSFKLDEAEAEYVILITVSDIVASTLCKYDEEEWGKYLDTLMFQIKKRLSYVRKMDRKTLRSFLESKGNEVKKVDMGKEFKAQ